MINVAVAGACGRMGFETVKMILSSDCFALSGAFDRKEFEGADAAGAGSVPCGVKVSSSIEQALKGAQCLVDFTNMSVSASLIRAAVNMGIPCVSGTTGHTAAELEEIAALASEKHTSVLIVPNFSIGAVLMMRFAEQAAKYFEAAEIIELHHDKKLDSPSGTSVKTLEGMLRARDSFRKCGGDRETLPNARGACRDGVRIHSVRLPGFVAHQEVLFGSIGEYLTLRHDSTSRVCFMSGVSLALKGILSLEPGFYCGLEHVMNEG